MEKQELCTESWIHVQPAAGRIQEWLSLFPYSSRRPSFPAFLTAGVGLLVNEQKGNSISSHYPTSPPSECSHALCLNIHTNGNKYFRMPGSHKERELNP
jgi:hypothetical protein